MKGSDKARAIFKSFGFDDFMIGQMMVRLESEGLISAEPLGDSIGTVLRTLEEQGWELHEVHSAVEAMQDAGVVFRER
ncbi:helix-turn-helix DNA-binding domain protein [Streptomyces phage ClubPenguin]|nr:helix-turn-helix DNA-binding domain protein [Streptomyces phage ClubPenguin]